MNRITRQILQHINSIDRKVKQINLSKHLKKEVDIGANGTQDYVVKKGINKDTIATTKQ